MHLLLQTLPLAMPDPWTIGLSIFDGTFGTIISFVIWRISVAQRRMDRDQREMHNLKADVKTGEERLHAVTVKLVDERFRSFTHEIREDMNGLTMAVTDFKERLADGDSAMGKLREGDHQLKLELKDGMHAITDWVRDSAASREDVKSHQTSVDQKFEVVNEKLSVIATRVSTLDATIKTGRRNA